MALCSQLAYSFQCLKSIWVQVIYLGILLSWCCSSVSLIRLIVRKDRPLLYLYLQFNYSRVSRCCGDVTPWSASVCASQHTNVDVNKSLLNTISVWNELFGLRWDVGSGFCWRFSTCGVHWPNAASLCGSLLCSAKVNRRLRGVETSILLPVFKLQDLGPYFCLAQQKFSSWPSC